MLYMGAKPIQELFRNANLKRGQRITIVKENDFGCLSVVKATFDSAAETTYAQYNDVVKIRFKSYRKHSSVCYYLHDEFVILNGWVDIPKENWMYGAIMAGSKPAVIAEKCGGKVLIAYIKRDPVTCEYMEQVKNNTIFVGM